MSVAPASSNESDVDVTIENFSFASHVSNFGRATAADLESVAMAAAGAARMSEIGDGDQEAAVSEAGGEASATASVAGQSDFGSDPTTSQIVKSFLKTAYPLSLSLLAQFSFNVVILARVGKMVDEVALGGASLALGLINATGFAFAAGLCGAMETVLSHLYGAFLTRKQREKAAARANGTTPPVRTLHMYGVYAQRMSIILLVTAIPLGVILCYADQMMQWFGQPKSTIHYTGEFCRWALLGLPATMLYQLTQRYYSCQQFTKPLAFALLGGAIANPILQTVCIKLFGFTGAPIGWAILMMGLVGGLLGYLYKSGRYKETWGGWDERATKDIKSLVGLALPSMGVMISEWVALEINALASGSAPPDQLAAYAITLQIFGVMWGVASGVMILTCVFVGNAVGEGKPLLARKISFIAIGIVFGIAIFDVAMCFLLGPFIPYFFNDKKEVAEEYHKLMWVVLPYHFFDTFQSTVMGILRGCELQKLGAVVITVAFCVVGVPLSFLLFFHFRIGVVALWLGPFVGVAVVGAPVYVYLLFRYIKWEELKPHTDHGTEQVARDVVIEDAPSVEE